MKKLSLSILSLVAWVYPTFGQQLVGFSKGDPVLVYYSPLEAFEVSSKLKFSKIELGNERILLSINNCGMLTTNLERTKVDCTINGHTTSYNISVPGYAVGMSEDCKFFVFSDSDDTISIIKNGQLVDKIAGNLPQVMGNYVYYHYSKVSSPGMTDIFRVRLDDLSKREIVVKNIFDMGVLVFDDGKYIACAVPNEAGPQSAVYKMDSKSFKILTKSDPANFPIYFPKTKSLRYLNITSNTFGNETVYR
jgi:hypothetical protein